MSVPEACSNLEVTKPWSSPVCAQHLECGRDEFTWQYGQKHVNPLFPPSDVETEVEKSPTVLLLSAFLSVAQEVADLTLFTPCRLAGVNSHFADEENTVRVVID